MGLTWSSYKSKRKEKKDHKRKLRKQLKEAEECIARLQKQLQLENESLDQLYQSHLPAGSRPEADTAHVECEVAEMVEEVQALERKLFLDEIALNVTDERCDFLDKNYRLLQSNESGLHRRSSVCHASLEELKLKQEACQFSQFLNANALEDWIVCSLPNIFLNDLQL